MYRVTVIYDQTPDADAYAGHAEVCARVPSAAFRHGAVFGSPMGETPYKYVAEFEFPDKAAFDAALASKEFAATLPDLRERNLPMPAAVFFAEVA